MRKASKLYQIAVLLLVIIAAVGCGKKAVVAPVPNAIDAMDAYAYRGVSDAEAAITVVKTWEVCSEQKFPATVDVDGKAHPCDKTAGTFSPEYKPYLNAAIDSHNTAQSLGLAYHSGASKDAEGLAQALTQLGLNITKLLTKVGGVK